MQYVNEDKRLWIVCLQREVIAMGIGLPRYRLSVEHASATDVRSWVKSAVALRKAYSSGGQDAKVVSIVEDEGLEVTWVKVVRGRWCLVASSNVTTSFVGIWRIRSDGSLKLENRFYLPGPVLDGVVDDVMEEICIAITVATTYASKR